MKKLRSKAIDLVLRVTCLMASFYACAQVLSSEKEELFTENQSHNKLTARYISLSEVLSIVEKQNPSFLLSEKQVEREIALKRSPYLLPNTEILWEAPTGDVLRPGVLQNIPYLGAIASQVNAQKQRILLSEIEKKIVLQRLRYNATFIYNEIQYLLERVRILQEQDTFYSNIVEITRIRRELGEITKLEQLNAESRYKQVQTQLDASRAELRGVQAQLAYIIGMPYEKNLIPNERITHLPFLIDKPIFDSTAILKNPLLSFNQQQERLNEFLLQSEKRSRLPGIIIGYLNQGADNTPLEYRLRLGISFPLAQWLNSSRIKAAQKNLEISRLQTLASALQLNNEYSMAVSRYRQYGEALQYYEEIGLAQASEILRNAKESYRLGNIPYYNYIQNSELAYQIRLNYLETLRNYNQAVLMIQYLQGDL
ncbi:MAG: TolC family protein [Cytophagales bacterium]|nr:TolC family protein [Cytophagales bacterium]MDW8383277.1 TolC family protein [Flammeovirgaceae bacterium]